MSESNRRANLIDWLKTLPLYPLPHHLVSRVVLRATRSRHRGWKNALIRVFVRVFRVDMSQAIEHDPTAYENFNAFFTRALTPDARPLPRTPDAVLSPADGTLSQIGDIAGDRLLQAKGRTFTTRTLLGDDIATAEPFRDGRFATVYLSPRDYHRVHIPVAGTLRSMIHIPGRLFSVAPHTVRTVPGLFARNERVAVLFETERGPMAVVLVGAICVASIETVWSGVVTPPRASGIRRWDYDDGPRLERGAELGRFNMGSTVVLLFGPGQVEWDVGHTAGQDIRMGQTLGTG